MILGPRTFVRIMGGEVTGRNNCNVPGPGHSLRDRSLSITIDPRAPGGFIVHFGGNDWQGLLAHFNYSPEVEAAWLAKHA